MRPLPVLFAVLLLTSSVAGTAGVSGLALPSTQSDEVSPTVDVAQNRTLTNVLTLTPSDVERTNFSQSGSNASAALSLRNARLSNQLNTGRTDARLASLETESEKRAYIRRALTEVEIRAGELREAERQAFRRHSTGELETSEFITELARIHIVSKELSQNTTRLAAASESIEGFNIQTRVDAINLELRTLQGPVRAHAAEAVRGGTAPTRVYTSTTSDGVVLTTIVDETYVREVYDGSNRISESESRINGTEVDNLMSQSYPTLYERSIITGSIASEIWQATIPFRRGAVTAFIDGDAPGRIFKEERSMTLNRTPPAEPVNQTRVGLTLTVYPSYPGGPMLVRVTDTQTGEPVRADVSLISVPQSSSQPVEVGTTNETGFLWTISPSEEFTVQAIKTGTQSVVDIRVEPLPPNAIYGDGGPGGNQSLAAPLGRD